VTHVVSRRQRALSHAPSNKRMKLTRGEGRSDTPEAGSQRVVLELRYRGGHVVRLACYLTPRRYFLEGLLGELSPAQRFASFLGSYRLRESCAQPAP